MGPLSNSGNDEADSRFVGQSCLSSAEGASAQALRFGVFGGLSLTLNYMVFVWLYLALTPSFPYFVSYLLAYLIGMLSSHLGYRKWVFHDRSPYLRSLGRFFLSTSLVSALQFGLFSVIVALSPQNALILHLIATISLAGLSFIIGRAWTFRNRRTSR